MNTQQTTQFDAQAIIGDIETPYTQESSMNEAGNYITQGCTTAYFSCHQC